MTLFGSLWDSLRLFGSLWDSLALFGTLLDSLGLFGSLWESLRVFGTLWDSLGPLGIFPLLKFLSFSKFPNIFDFIGSFLNLQILSSSISLNPQVT